MRLKGVQDLIFSVLTQTKMNRLLKFPTTCPALARLPMRASMSLKVCV